MKTESFEVGETPQEKEKKNYKRNKNEERRIS